MRLPAVQAVTGLSCSSIYAMIARDEFPKQVQISPKVVGWRQSEIQEWIDGKVRARDTAQKRVAKRREAA
ncbi:MAG TPA: AlpA family phage regulatory protein [Beijerinckiaceae bacterium]|nr:AlpA family phage regulatory protein [Beijerinckiaceae bacterium]